MRGTITFKATVAVDTNALNEAEMRGQIKALADAINLCGIFFVPHDGSEHWMTIGIEEADMETATINDMRPDLSDDADDGGYEGNCADCGERDATPGSIYCGDCLTKHLDRAATARDEETQAARDAEAGFHPLPGGDFGADDEEIDDDDRCPDCGATLFPCKCGGPSDVARQAEAAAIVAAATDADDGGDDIARLVYSRATGKYLGICGGESDLEPGKVEVLDAGPFDTPTLYDRAAIRFDDEE